jgi:hypothetical protein
MQNPCGIKIWWYMETQHMNRLITCWMHYSLRLGNFNLRSPYDTLAAWVWSVNEALQVVQFHDANLRDNTRHYF